MRTFVYRGNWRGSARLFPALGRSEDTTPLVVNDNVSTAIVPFESADTPLPTAYAVPSAVPAYPLAEMPLAQTAMQTAPVIPAYTSGEYRTRQYGRNPSSLGDRLLDAYAMSLELLGALWSGVKGRILLKA